MLSLIAIVSLAATLVPAAADPVAILKAGAEACRNVRSAKYAASWELTDANAPQQVEAEVAFVKWPPDVETPPPPPPKPNADGSIPAMPMITPKVQTVFNADLRVAISTGEVRTFNHDRGAAWNPADKTFKVMASRDGGEKLVVQDTAVMLLDSPLLQPDSIGRLLKMAEHLTVGTRENIDGVECDVVTARMPKLDATTDVVTSIALGVDDHLPRRTTFEQFTGGKSTMREMLSISNLQANVDLNSAIFAQQAPEGVSAEIVKPEPPPEMLAVGTTAPGFTLQDPAGKTVTMDGLKGKVVLIDFWGTWCGPCKMAMPSIQKVHAKFKERGLVVIGISCREKPGADPAKTMKELGCDYGLLLNGETIVKDWHVPGYPTLYLIDQQGRIAHAELGFDEELEGKLSEAIETLLK